MMWITSKFAQQRFHGLLLPCDFSYPFHSSGAPNNTHDNIALLHNKHGHADFRKICEYYNIPVPKKFPPCFACIRGKMHRSTPTEATKAKPTRPGEVWNTDIRGPMPVMAKDGSWYSAFLVCGYTGIGHVLGFKSPEQWQLGWEDFTTN
jgi:hypothetical protein